MANIQHDSEEKLIDFDAIESSICNMERDFRNSTERTHEEFGAFWINDSPEHYDVPDVPDIPDISNSSDDSISGWQTKPVKRNVTNEDIYNAICSVRDDVRELRQASEQINKILIMIRNIHTALGIPENSGSA